MNGQNSITQILAEGRKLLFFCVAYFFSIKPAGCTDPGHSPGPAGWHCHETVQANARPFFCMELAVLHRYAITAYNPIPYGRASAFNIVRTGRYIGAIPSMPCDDYVCRSVVDRFSFRELQAGYWRLYSATKGLPAKYRIITAVFLRLNLFTRLKTDPLTVQVQTGPVSGAVRFITLDQPSISFLHWAFLLVYGLHFEQKTNRLPV